MEVATFAEIEEEFRKRVGKIVWCTVTTVNRQDRPRSRILHPLWEGSTGWIATSKLAQALSAEGAPCGAHYIGQPIFMYDLLRQKTIYGDSTYPFSLQPQGQEVRYELGECPQTERILDDLLQVSVNEKMTDADVSDILACFEKVWANLDELREA